MKCLKCNKEIDDNKKICDECSKNILNETSKLDIDELEKLIESNKKLNELENTKELYNLKDLDKNLEKEEVSTKREDIHKIYDNVDEDFLPKKRSKKIIIVIVILLLIIVSIITFILINNNNKTTKEEINYKSILNEYGKSVESAILKYKENNNELPNWDDISDMVEYTKYNVNCNIHEIYEDSTIYLDECKVNKKSIKYTYGKKEEVNNNKVINIYKTETGYSDTGVDLDLVGNITCQTEDCMFVLGYDDKTIIEEESKYYLYDYINNKMLFGPFDIGSNMLSENNILYAIIYKEDNQTNLYNPKNNKIFKNIEGIINSNTLKLIKYNYLILENNNKSNFLNLNTGNISYTISNSIDSFIEDSVNNITYIKVNGKTNNFYKIYNSNGKLMFDGDEFNKVLVSNGNLIVANNTQFKVFNKEIITNSNKYESIIEIYDKYIIVTNNKKVIILDINDIEITSFDNTSNTKVSNTNLVDNNIIINMMNGVKYSYNTNTKKSSIN